MSRNRARYAAIIPTWGTDNRVLTPVAEPVQLGLISHPEAAAQLEAVAAWIEDAVMAGAPPRWVAIQAAAAAREVAAQVRQSQEAAMAGDDDQAAAVLRREFPAYEIGPANGKWHAFPYANPLRLLTASSAGELHAVLTIDQAARSPGR